jgi:integrase
MHCLRPWTLYTLFGLLSVSGMRISEALQLKSTDIDWDAGVLTVRLTKFGKSRLVPLHPPTVQALAAYALRRDLIGKRAGSKYDSKWSGAWMLVQIDQTQLDVMVVDESQRLSNRAPSAIDGCSPPVE